MLQLTDYRDVGTISWRAWKAIGQRPYIPIAKARGFTGILGNNEQLSIANSQLTIVHASTVYSNATSPVAPSKVPIWVNSLPSAFNWKIP